MRPYFWLAALCILLIGGDAANACSDHEDPAVGRDRLAANYPGALDILQKIAAARREKLLPPANPMAALWADKFPLPRHRRALEEFEQALNGAAQGRAELTFSLVMIEPMLWTRYTAAGGEIKATIHTEGPQAGELVLVSAEDVVGAIGGGRWSITQAYALGLLGLHGKNEDVQQFLASYGGHSHRAVSVSP